ncbi:MULTISPECIES: hypothetical protein [unclassified Aliivibrio]|jgi:hypothetical protein|uniref:hypothetical protein n=1 Tax=unclassified Aliivibrio TaxID=2645654 RepID=UPI00080DF170|nr:MULTISPECIES: hypothetical protein [unclassified Aliivibrio]OCH13702.1 hypothetical protein A6E05_05190 [Aliivibrio sp. 1S165]OCH23752.1 hypothetical protein A6E03_08915 [Aliivibrio sp. 1S128]OCH31656.1 hypothetical protein A6E06_03245 [Aliivibrio sp. 1S175]
MRLPKKTVLLAVCLFGLSSYAQSSEKKEYEFDSVQVDKIMSVAYENKKARYTEFAQLFNFCQQKPNHQDCQQKYEKATSNYESVKANYSVINMVNTPELQTLLMPEITYPELVDSLKGLGYLKNGMTSDINYEDTLSALNEWLEIHEMEKTSTIYLLHALMVQTEELSQIILDEKLS